jgi:hypothetical protein
MTTIQIRPTPVFERILDIPYDVCRDVALGAGLGLQRTSGAMTSAPVRIRRGLFRRHVPMQLRVEPWSVDGSATAVILAPLTRRRRTRRYFQAGHALLDDLSSVARTAGESNHHQDRERDREHRDGDRRARESRQVTPQHPSSLGGASTAQRHRVERLRGAT